MWFIYVFIFLVYIKVYKKYIKEISAWNVVVFCGNHFVDYGTVDSPQSSHHNHYNLLSM